MSYLSFKIQPYINFNVKLQAIDCLNIKYMINQKRESEGEINFSIFDKNIIKQQFSFQFALFVGNIKFLRAAEL